jgi:hypothetical protein
MHSIFPSKPLFFISYTVASSTLSSTGNFDPLANEMVLTAARMLSSPKKCTLGQNVWSK